MAKNAEVTSDSATIIPSMAITPNFDYFDLMLVDPLDTHAQHNDKLPTDAPDKHQFDPTATITDPTDNPAMTEFAVDVACRLSREF